MTPSATHPSVNQQPNTSNRATLPGYQSVSHRHSFMAPPQALPSKTQHPVSQWFCQRGEQFIRFLLKYLWPMATQPVPIFTNYTPLSSPTRNLQQENLDILYQGRSMALLSDDLPGTSSVAAPAEKFLATASPCASSILPETRELIQQAEDSPWLDHLAQQNRFLRQSMARLSSQCQSIDA